MTQVINEGDDPSPQDTVPPGEEADRHPRAKPAPEAGESLTDEERRAQKARRVITIAQVVLAVAQTVDGVVRMFS
ncbi:hypothetical protein [Amycolatopsis sp. NBC_01480]|uniref:hypothetical protein n=1 Tax=Amycolatopsis sp. NBC_01480 TaxID=2903562 RepID=UPI002E2D927D|nr:hypothetical protein [Amycolatopsis sp. NBC_01480]